MAQGTFNTVAGVIFGLIAILHGVRIVAQWNAVIGEWTIPLWTSVLALLVGAYLAYSAWRLR